MSRPSDPIEYPANIFDAAEGDLCGCDDPRECDWCDVPDDDEPACLYRRSVDAHVQATADAEDYEREMEEQIASAIKHLQPGQRDLVEALLCLTDAQWRRDKALSFRAQAADELRYIDEHRCRDCGAFNKDPSVPCRTCDPTAPGDD